MRRLAGLALLLLLATGCATYHRGRLAAASSVALPVAMRALGPSVRGVSCGQWSGRRLQAAVEDALRQASGADALVDVSFHFERLCLVVRGTPVQLPAPAEVR